MANLIEQSWAGPNLPGDWVITKSDQGCTAVVDGSLGLSLTPNLVCGISARCLTPLPTNRLLTIDFSYKPCTRVSSQVGVPYIALFQADASWDTTYAHPYPALAILLANQYNTTNRTYLYVAQFTNSNFITQYTFVACSFDQTAFVPMRMTLDLDPLLHAFQRLPNSCVASRVPSWTPTQDLYLCIGNAGKGTAGTLYERWDDVFAYPEALWQLGGTLKDALAAPVSAAGRAYLSSTGALVSAFNTSPTDGSFLVTLTNAQHDLQFVNPDPTKCDLLLPRRNPVEV